jgi:hypothetical protein
MSQILTLSVALHPPNRPFSLSFAKERETKRVSSPFYLLKKPIVALSSSIGLPTVFQKEIPKG